MSLYIACSFAISAAVLREHILSMFSVYVNSTPESTYESEARSCVVLPKFLIELCNLSGEKLDGGLELASQVASTCPEIAAVSVVRREFHLLGRIGCELRL